MKKVLIASYYFPPHSHPGVQRPLKFAKYLPSFGYQPIVYTCGNMPWNDFDYETYETEVKGRMIIRSISAPNFKALGKPISMRTLPAKAVLKLQTILFEDRMEWALGGRAEFVARAKDDSIDLVYTTGPPHSVHFIGSYLKSRLNIPWIADFRDEMATHPPAVGLKRLAGFLSELKKKTIISFLEGMIIKKCDALVTVSDPITVGLKFRYPRLADKMITIYNGFDEDDFQGVLPTRSKPEGFNLVHTGRFWDHRTPETFLKGLERALEKRPGLKNDLTVTFVGPYDQRLSKEKTSETLHGVISVSGPVSHRDAIAYQLGSDANLLILSHFDKQGRSPIVSGKIFEYLRAGRPILAVVPEGPACDLAVKARLGYLASPNSPEEIARAIIKLHGDWKTGVLGTVKPPEEVIEGFSRKNLTRTLAGVFNTCLS